MQTIVPAIMFATRERLTNLADIINTYYEALYGRAISLSETSLTEEFNALSLPILAPEDVESLEAPISVLEIEAAIESLNNNKTPGPDGVPWEFYKT